MVPAYREYRPPAGLESVVACLWERARVAGVAAELGVSRRVLAAAGYGPKMLARVARLRPGSRARRT